MTREGRRLGATAPPIAVQILALLIGGLVAAQAATLALSLIAPPSTPEYQLDDIARALRGGALRGEGLPPLERGAQTRPPDPRSPGWQTSAASETELARLLGVDAGRVRLLFYSPPPFAGAPMRSGDAGGPHAHVVEANLLAPLLMAPPPGSGPGGGGGPSGGAGGGGGPGGGGPGGGSGGWNGPGGGRQGGGGQHGGRGGDPGGAGGPTSGGGQRFDPPLAPAVQGAPDAPARGSQGAAQPPERGAAASGGEPVRSGPNGDGPIATAPRTGGVQVGPPAPGAAGGRASGGLPPPLLAPGLASQPGIADAGAAPVSAQSFDPVIRTPRAPSGGVKTAAATSAPAGPALASVPAAAIVEPPAAAARIASSTEAPPQTLAPPTQRTLFGVARAPVVDGEFLAALQVGPARWITVRPLQDPVLSAWQRRLALWFLLSFAAVAPLGYLLSRRLAAPLADLADSADRLGRDPAAPITAGGGAPEIRRLAEALAGMQARLRRHVDDRTAMVGAISHDLRTPLARLRFKLERAPAALKASMLRDMVQMEEMLNAVLIFIRDASEPATRQMADLRSIVECVVDDAALMGADATLEPGAPAAVEVDITAVQRVVANLVENALKYGGCAHVRLYAEAGEAVVAVADAGEGLPDDELETVFKPFYRSEGGRRITGSGIGLGLSTSRSLARAHGGEVRLRNGSDGGLIAELRLPLALGFVPHRVAVRPSGAAQAA